MLKRRAALPQGIRWLAGGIAAAVLVLAIVWALFVPLADWLAHHDVNSAKGSLHETALDNARGRLLTLGAGLFAAGALVFTARNFTVSRRTLELAAQGQVTDRYTKAIEQLGSDKLDVRIGGIYALERVARDSAMDHPTVMEVLSAFVREHSRVPWPPPADDEPSADVPERATRPDVQAAITVIGRRTVRHDRQLINLTRAILPGADLSAADLSNADLTRADLTGADLTRADLTRAYLGGADLPGAYLGGATLSNADLTRADLTGAHLPGADLTGACLRAADLTRAHLSDLDLASTHLPGPRSTLADGIYAGADLTSADLQYADLTDADLTGVRLGAVNLTRAAWPEGVPIPEGWQRDTHSRRLKKADTSSGGTATN